MTKGNLQETLNKLKNSIVRTFTHETSLLHQVFPRITKSEVNTLNNSYFSIVTH